MKLHNQMEEYVEDRVRDIYGQLEKENVSWIKCSCESCILDAIGYVLNRVKPHYIISGRGAVYSSQTLYDHQLKADVDALAMNAIQVINSVQRPYHKITATQTGEKKGENSPTFNFPIINGTVLDGETFEPIVGAKITLKIEDEIVEMQDGTWENPCQTFKTTNGNFSFWPKSVKAKKVDETKKFMFVAQAHAENYQDVIHTFEITLSSEAKKRSFINNSVTMKVPEFVMFHEEY